MLLINPSQSTLFIGYLAAFTALCMDYLDYGELVWKVELLDGSVTANMCRPLKWDYVRINRNLIDKHRMIKTYLSSGHASW